MKTTLIIVTGLPCTGKTTIGRKIADHFKMPFLSKDEIKELIFDNIGYSDREYSKNVGKTAYAIIFNYAKEYLQKGISVVVESNFKAEFDNRIFQEIERKYKPNIVQLLCHADGKVLFNRFKARSESGNRHPGHMDADSLNEWEPILTIGKGKSLEVSGKLIEIDTTDFARVNIDAILKSL
jgi:predicted kinase